MSKIKLIWITPSAESIIVSCARVKPDTDPDGSRPDRLIRYLIQHAHWSPFEMASMCVEIETSRDISRQILRHRSFSFQEFSTRYHAVEAEPIYREARLQDAKNRQNSLETNDLELQEEWHRLQEQVYATAKAAYDSALQLGIAKEQARALLPEGMVKTRLYMTGTLRSWIHYCGVRRDPTTQKEHREVAEAVWALMQEQVPAIVGSIAERSDAMDPTTK